MALPIVLDHKHVNKIIRRFKERYSHLIRYGTDYEPIDDGLIRVYIPGVGKLDYNVYSDKIIWLEHWVDDKELKRREKEQRPEIYEEFCLIIYEYMRCHKMTQQEFADIVGISRRSISKYLNGDRIPKVSTMRNICKAVNIEL